MTVTRNGTFILAGIVSFGYGCGLPGTNFSNSPTKMFSKPFPHSGCSLPFAQYKSGPNADCDCFLAGYPGVYTKVSSMVPWILDTMRKQS